MSVDVRAPGEFVLTCYRCGVQSEPRTTATEARRAGKRRGWGRSYPRGRGEAFVCPRCKGGDVPDAIVDDVVTAQRVDAWVFSWTADGETSSIWFTLVRDGEAGDEWSWISSEIVSTWAAAELVEYLRMRTREIDLDADPAYRRALDRAADVVERTERMHALARS